jgi:dihydroxy-acid dehydratase
MGGIALGREWTADRVHADLGFVSDAVGGLDVLTLSASEMEDLAALLIVALRLDLPAVIVPVGGGPYDAAFRAMGLVPLARDPVGVALSMADDGGPRPRELVDTFSLANALRAGLAAGGGPELLVHLAALAREAGVAGFGQMVRVLASETSGAGPEWLREHGVPGLLSSLGDALHDVPTVAGNLKENLPPMPPPAEEHSRLVFVKARTSGAEAVCRVRKGITEVEGVCRVFDSEKEVVSSMLRDEIGEGTMLVVGGCGPRGGPGLLRLDALGRALEEAGLEVPVLTDGLAPKEALGPWISVFTPEAAAGSVLGLLRDGDNLRIDLTEGRIRTRAREFESREPDQFPDLAESGYAARYARTALPALEGAGFG